MAQGVSTQTSRWILMSLAVLIALMLTGLALTVRTLRWRSVHAAPAPSRATLTCTGITTRLILEDPECADKVLRTMNVTHVRILPRSAVTSGPHSQTGQSALNST